MHVITMPGHIAYVEWDILDSVFNVVGGFITQFTTPDAGSTVNVNCYGLSGDGSFGADVLQHTTLNAWHHVVSTYNPTSHLFSFYLDGVLIGTQAPTVSWPTANVNPPSPTISVSNDVAVIFDELGVWTSHALTLTEVQTLYSSGIGSRPTGVNPASDPPVVPSVSIAASPNPEVFNYPIVITVTSVGSDGCPCQILKNGAAFASGVISGGVFTANYTPSSTGSAVFTAKLANSPLTSPLTVVSAQNPLNLDAASLNFFNSNTIPFGGAAFTGVIPVFGGLDWRTTSDGFGDKMTVFFTGGGTSGFELQVAYGGPNDWTASYSVPTPGFVGVCALSSTGGIGPPSAPATVTLS
jgi:hypothetical protein